MLISVLLYQPNNIRICSTCAMTYVWIVIFRLFFASSFRIFIYNLYEIGREYTRCGKSPPFQVDIPWLAAICLQSGNSHKNRQTNIKYTCGKQIKIKWKIEREAKKKLSESKASIQMRWERKTDNKCRSKKKKLICVCKYGLVDVCFSFFRLLLNKLNAV